MLVLALLLSIGGAAGAADVQDHLGKLIADVRVEVAGVRLEEPFVLQLIETRTGEPLSMQQVRESIDHLVGLGRFEDIRVFARPAAAPAGAVAVTWALVPVQRIEDVSFSGNLRFSSAALEAAVQERFSTLPVAARAREIEELLRAYYLARGYRAPAIASRLLPGRDPESVRLALDIDAGPQTVVRSAEVQGAADRPAVEVIRDLALSPGSAYNPAALDARVAALESRLHGAGYYEAQVDVSATFPEQASADVLVEVDRGPLVRVVFAGDPLPENRRDALVPIRQERSVDLDLLEDASRNIEAFLRQQGYREAEAPYVREEQAGELTLTFNVSRGPLHRLARIDTAGNEQVSTAEIAPLLVLRQGEPFVDSRIATVAAAIEELYRVRGFTRAQVRPQVSVQPAAPQGGMREVGVTLAITEGPQTLVQDVAVEGASALDPARVRALLGLTPGRPYYRPQLQADRDTIERLYHNEGFQSVRVEPETTASDRGRQLSLVWRIAEGPQVLVDRVLISGNDRTSADLIRREIVLEPGQPLGDDAVVESQRRLAALGLFRRVRILELPHSGNTRRDILIEIEEAPATAITYGGGLEAGRTLRTGDDGQPEERIDVAPRGFFEISRRNLWGKNRSVSLFTRVSLRPRDPGVEPDDPTDSGGYGFNEYRVVGTWREPRLFDRPGDLQLTGFLEQAIRSSFNFGRRGVRVDYARRFGTLTLSGRYSFDRTKLFDLKFVPGENPQEQLFIDRLFPQVRLSTVTGSILRDTRDDVIDPTGGTLAGSDVTVALRSLGSEVGFAKTFFQGFVYRKMPRAPLTLVAGARLGLAVGFERVLDDGTVVNDVPVSERFFAGGDTTVRGFVLDRLGTAGTLNDQGFPTGGSGLAVLNLELRTAYWKGLGAVGFFDAGNVFSRAADISLGDLRPAAGVGLRYRSPLGPLRFDLGFNLDRQVLPGGARERGLVFHLSLGQAF